MKIDVKWTPSIPEGRWATLGPYYAMFPTDFVRDAIARFSKVGDGVIDPFCGRGTVPFVASSTGRFAVGMDVNPWPGFTRRQRPRLNRTCRKSYVEFGKLARQSARGRGSGQRVPGMGMGSEDSRIPECRPARALLEERTNRLDAGRDHPDLPARQGGGAVSNQMRQSKAMAPNYSVQWWKARGSRP